MAARFKDIVLIFLAIPFILVVGYIPQDCQGATIKIGLLLDLSGPNRDIGNAMLHGANSAVKIWNPTLSRLGHNLELAVVDTGSQEGRLLLGAMRLEKKEGATILIGPTAPPMAKVLVGYAEAHEIPVIVASGNLMLSPSPWERFKWSYGVSPGIGHMIRSLYKNAKKRGINQIGILIEDMPEFDEDIRWLKGYSTEYRVRIVSVDGFSPVDTDCVSQLRHLKDSGAQLVIYRGDKAFIPRLFGSLNSVPIPVAFLMDTPFTPDKRRRLPTAQLWIQSPLLFSNTIDSLPQKLDIIRFKNALGSTTVRSREQVIAAAKAWDAIGLVVEALRNGAYPSRRGFIRVFEGRRSSDIKIYLRYHGLIGDFRPDRRDHIGLDPGDLFFLQLD